MLSRYISRGVVGFHGSTRAFHTLPVLRSGSLFGDLTKPAETPAAPVNNNEQTPTDITPANDQDLQEYYMKQAKEDQIHPEKYVSPLKRKLFALNVKSNGFFKNGHIIKDPETSKTYKLTLTPEEIDILEPSVFLHSYRIKSSMKKATLVNRFVRGWNVKSAINQLHFNPKKMSTELEKLLKKGLEQAKSAGLTEDELYIQSLWTGSDGDWRKRLDPKGRGRAGIIEHPYIHLKAVLRGDQTKQRIKWEKEQKKEKSKPEMFLINEPLNFSVRPYYRW